MKKKNNMKRVAFWLVFFLIIFVIFLIAKSGLVYKNDRRTDSVLPTKSVTIPKTSIYSAMNITSTAFANQQPIPGKYTCQGNNVNPPLQFGDVPDQAKSLVLIMDDPDAPMGTWVHWTIFNMEPRTLGIEENTKPTSGTEAMTSFGKPGYGGPCPPSGTHHYHFKLYALDTKLDLMPTADKKAIESAMQGHIIVQAELVGLFSK